MTRILVDHGSAANLGDTAMLEGVVRRLCTVRPRCELFVVDRPALRTDVWELSNVSPVKCRIRNPFLDFVLPRLRRRFVWRFADRAAATCHRWSQECLDGMIDTSRLVVETDCGRTELLNWCEAFDALHIVGGGNLTDVFPPELWQRTCLMHAFARQGKPVVLTGQQLGPFRSRFSARGLARALRKASFIGLREPDRSVEFCERAGLAPDQYAVMGDDSFGITAASRAECRDVLARHGLEPGNFLAVNVRIADYAAGHGRHLARIAAIVAEVSGRMQRPVLFVPVALNPCDNDVVSGHRLRDAIGQSARIAVLDGTGLTPRLVKGLLSLAWGAVGVSYHFCTFALCEGVPAVCLFDGDYYAQKALGLARFWGDRRLALALEGVDPREAAQRLGALLADNSLREGLRARAADAKADWQQTFDRVAGRQAATFPQ